MSWRKSWQKGRASSRRKVSLGKTQGKQGAVSRAGVARSVGCTWPGIQESGTDHPSLFLEAWPRCQVWL